MKTRPVLVFKWDNVGSIRTRDWEKIEVGAGKFHQFGVNCDESGNYSTAIVEMPDGTMVNVPVELIQFTDTDTKVPMTVLHKVVFVD